MLRKKQVNHTGRTKKLLTDNKYIFDDTERKNCWSGHKNDFLGFGDLIALKIGKPTTIIQVTSGGQHTTRVKKITGKPIAGKVDKKVARNAKYALKCGVVILVISWNKKNNRWVPRTQQITLKDF